MVRLKGLFGDEGKKVLRQHAESVAAIAALEPELEALSDETLRGMTAKLRSRIAAGESLSDVLPEAFAAVREAAKRTVSSGHSTCSSSAAWCSIARHRRDADRRRQDARRHVAGIFQCAHRQRRARRHGQRLSLAPRRAYGWGRSTQALGLSVGIINHEASFMYDPSHDTKQKMRCDDEDAVAFQCRPRIPAAVHAARSYAADITYGTNNEFGFDYLRDKFRIRAEIELRQRGHSITPSSTRSTPYSSTRRARRSSFQRRPAESEDLYRTFAGNRLAAQARRGLHRRRKAQSDSAHRRRHRKGRKSCSASRISTPNAASNTCITSKQPCAPRRFSIKTKNMSSKTARSSSSTNLPAASSRAAAGAKGLHQAIEAKEGVAVQKESRTFASITYPKLFPPVRKACRHDRHGDHVGRRVL